MSSFDLTIPCQAVNLPNLVIENNGEYKFQKELAQDKILCISLKILREEDLWGIEGQVILTYSSQKKPCQRIHSIRTLVLEKNEVRWIGSWLPVFEKTAPDGRMVTENCINEIPLDELGRLSNQTLLDISVEDNKLRVKSDYFSLISVVGE